MEERNVKVFAARPGDRINVAGFGECCNDPGAPADPERGIEERDPVDAPVMVTPKVARQLQAEKRDGAPVFRVEWPEGIDPKAMADEPEPEAPPRRTRRGPKKEG